MGEDFPDFFDDIDELLEEMQKEIEELMKEFRRDVTRKPFVKGFSFEIEDGRPVFKTFGDLSPRESAREPLVEQVISNGMLNLIAEMPGVEKDSIKLEADEDTVSIDAQSEDRVYKTRVQLKEAVDPDSGKATYKNGVLEIKFKLRGNGNKAYKQLDIE